MLRIKEQTEKKKDRARETTKYSEKVRDEIFFFFKEWKVEGLLFFFDKVEGGRPIKMFFVWKMKNIRLKGETSVVAYVACQTKRA